MAGTVAAVPQVSRADDRDVVRRLLDFTGSRDIEDLDITCDPWIERKFRGEELPGVKTSARWLCLWYKKSAAARQQLLKDPYTAFYLRVLERDDFRVLRTSLQAELDERPFGEFVSGGAFNEAEDASNFVVLGCPQRRVSERIPAIVAFLGLQPGDTVADIGAGYGLYAATFAEAVGPTGRVYAVDPNSRAVELLQEFIDGAGLTQLVAMEPAVCDMEWPERGVDYGIPPGSADAAFLMLVLEEILRLAPTAWRPELVAGISLGLKTGGTLVLCEKQAQKDSTRRLACQDFVDIFEASGFRSVGTLQVQKELYCLKLIKTTRAPDHGRD